MGLFGKSKQELKTEIEQLNVEISRLNGLLLPEHNDLVTLKAEIAALTAKKSELAASIGDLSADIAKKTQELSELHAAADEKEKEIYKLTTEIEMQEFGIYTPTYDFATSDLYKLALKNLRDMQKEAIKNGVAVMASSQLTVDGSVSKGTKMLKDIQKLLLRAFNSECDDIIEHVRLSNAQLSGERICKSAAQISKLAANWKLQLSDQYIQYKLQEMHLALDFQQKKAEEKEHIRALKEQQREEARVQKEIEEARKRLQKEQAHYNNALSTILERIAASGETAELLEKKEELLSHLDDTQKAIQDVDYREANKRAGYVYVISNVGAFGENVYKIGMTRRLDPMERVDELGDASVPFRFDVHALIFSDDAPSLENALHAAFESKKVNKVNHRREFFRVTLDEIKNEVRKNFDKTVEWADIPEADEYRQSLS